MDNLRGILLMVAAMAGFACEDAIIKHLSGTLPGGQIVLIAGLFGGTVFALLARRAGHRLLSRTLLHPAIIARNVSEMFGTAFFVLAIILTPLSSVSAIIQAMPLVVTLGAALFLGERVGWRRWTAISVGLVGVLIIIRPGAASFQPASLLALVSVLLLAARDVATRRVPKSVPSLVLACYGFLASVPGGAVLMIFGGGWQNPTPVAIGWLALLMGFAILAYYAIIAAMRIGEVAAVTPFRYSRLIFGTTFGVVFFGETLDAQTLVGAGIVIASGLYSLLREAQIGHRRRRLERQLR